MTIFFITVSFILGINFGVFIVIKTLVTPMLNDFREAMAGWGEALVLLEKVVDTNK